MLDLKDPEERPRWSWSSGYALGVCLWNRIYRGVLEKFATRKQHPRNSKNTPFGGCIAPRWGSKLQPFRAVSIITGRRPKLLRKVLYGMAASALLALLPAVAVAQNSTAQPVDPPQQVAQLRQKYEGLTPQQIEAQGYVAEGPCVPSPQGAGAMGIHAINRQSTRLSSPKERWILKTRPCSCLVTTTR